MTNKASARRNDIVATATALKSIADETGYPVVLVLEIAKFQQSRQQTQILERIAQALEEPQC